MYVLRISKCFCALDFYLADCDSIVQKRVFIDRDKYIRISEILHAPLSSQTSIRAVFKDAPLLSETFKSIQSRPFVPPRISLIVYAIHFKIQTKETRKKNISSYQIEKSSDAHTIDIQHVSRIALG